MTCARRITTIMVCLAALGAQTASALADASVTTSGGDAVYFGDQSKGEILSVYTANGYVHFEDDFQTLTASNNDCSTIGTHQVQCLITPAMTEVRIHGFGGNDVVDARGVSGLPTRIWGDEGNDDISGGGAINELHGGRRRRQAHRRRLRQRLRPDRGRGRQRHDEGQPRPRQADRRRRQRQLRGRAPARTSCPTAATARTPSATSTRCRP